MSDVTIYCISNYTDIRTKVSYPLKLHNLTSSEAILTTVAVGLLIQLLSVLFNIIRKYVHKQKDNLDLAFDAGGQVSTGLTVASLVASWTWSATLLESTTVTSKYGISGAFWYAAGACVQIMLFSILAVQFKIRAPGAKTFLQVIRCRFGKTTHIIFSCYALLTNIIVLGMLMLGGAQAIVTLVNDYSVELATIACATVIGANCLTGGLGAKFYASYFQSCGIFIIILILSWNIIFSRSLGSTFTSLKCMESTHESNFLGMGSIQGFMFGVINLVGNFGAIFADQVYWQSAVAAKPKQAVKGFLIAGLVWFSVPFCFATIMGLTYLDLSIKNGGHLLDEPQLNEGLVAVVVTTMTSGKSGKLFLFIILLLAVTSTGASEVIAIDSIIIYDFYMTYLKVPRIEKTRHSFKVSHNNTLRRSNCEIHGAYRDYVNDMNKKKSWSILITSVLIVPLALILFALGIKMSWIYMFMGVVIGSTVIPIILSLYWSRLNSVGMIAGSMGGTTFGIAAWLVAASQYKNGLGNFFQNTGRENVMLVGNLMSIISSAFFTIVLSLVTNKTSTAIINDGWTEAKNIDNPLYQWKDLYKKEMKSLRLLLHPAKITFSSVYLEIMFAKEKRLSICISLCLTFVLLFLWPLVWFMFGSFSLTAFTVWVFIATGAAIIAAIYLIFAPLFEETKFILKAKRKNRRRMPSVNSEDIQSIRDTVSVNSEQRPQRQKNSQKENVLNEDYQSYSCFSSLSPLHKGMSEFDLESQIQLTNQKNESTLVIQDTVFYSSEF